MTTNPRTPRRALLSGAIALGLAGAAAAGPHYVDGSGFALSGHDPVAYFDLKPAPLGERPPAAVAGDASITAEHDGATFAFASEENRERFLAEPEAFLPRYDGHCAYGVAQGGKVPGNPDLWRIVDGVLYLNINETVVGFWEEDVPGNLALAEANWPEPEAESASDRAIPDFDPAEAPLR